MPSVSIIIPCYNEKQYIDNTVRSVLEAFDGDSMEIIVVDDGSSDGSYKNLEGLGTASARIRVLRHEQNQGKGAAIRTGVTAADGEIVGFMDGDGEVDPQFLVKAVSILRESPYADIVIGNRYLIPGGYKTTPVRRLYSKVYQWMNTVLFALRWRDTQAGLKVFRSGIGKMLFTMSGIKGYAFDIDILAHAHLQKLAVEEIPIKQILKGQSTIGKNHIFQMIIDTVDTYRAFVREEWADNAKSGKQALLFAFLARQLLAIPTAIAAWLCAKLGLIVIKKVSKQ